MSLRPMVILAFALILAPACGDDDGADLDAAANDASTGPDVTPGPDGPTPDAGPLITDECPTSYGPTSVSSTFVVGEGNVGFDLDGDDEIDNNLGSNTVVRNLVNMDFQNSLNSGALRSLAELRDLADIGADDPSLSVVIYGGVDNDSPMDLTDDFNGDEDYYFAHEWVRWMDCSPKAIAAATYTGGVVTAEDDFISFYVDSLGGFLDIARPHISATIEADIAGAKTVDGTPAIVGGAVTSCSLARGQAALGNSAQHALLILGIQPDIDLDGDGLERIVGTQTFIEKCIDGDGTEIVGDLCGCDPRMKDGYSITFLTDLVGATLLGPVP